MATPRPNDMPPMVPSALERAINKIPGLNYGGWCRKILNEVIDLQETAFREGVLAERARSLNVRIKTALADGERDGRQLAEDCRITPEAANTPCYVPPNSTNLAERIPKSSASAEEWLSDYENGNAPKEAMIRIFAAAIASAETAARQAAIRECLACVTIPVNGTHTAKLLAIGSSILALLDSSK